MKVSERSNALREVGHANEILKLKDQGKTINTKQLVTCQYILKVNNVSTEIVKLESNK